MEWGLILVSGFLGSAHCVGMCGPIVVTIGSTAPSGRSNLGRQLLYSLGRLCTYSFLGACVGYLGLRMTHQWPTLRRAESVLAMLAGMLLVWQGLATARVLGSTKSPSPTGGCQFTGGLFAGLLLGTGAVRPFLSGLFTGFLPCGLVYGLLALAASTTNVASGAAVMAVFGLGTTPLMIATGCGGRLLSPLFRSQILQAAAWCVVVTGALTATRGALFLCTGDDSVLHFCGLC